VVGADDTGFPHGIESIEKVLDCEISFQDREKVLNLAKMYIEHWKSIKIPIQPLFISFFSLPLMKVLQMFFCTVFHA